MTDSGTWKTVLELAEPKNIYFGDHIDCRSSNIKNRTYFCNWWPSDSKATYRSYKLSNEVLYDDTFGYDVNKNYFRCDEFDSLIASKKKKLLVFGCSFTFGTGLPEEHVWPSILSKMISYKTGDELDIINLSIPGGSYSDIDRLSNYIYMFSVDYICCLLPPLPRKSFIDLNGHFQSMSMATDGKNKIHKLFDDMVKYSYGTFEYEQLVVMKKLEAMAKILGAKFCFINPFGGTINLEDAEIISYSNMYNIKPITTQARDISHPGNKYQIEVAHTMMEKLYE